MRRLLLPWLILFVAIGICVASPAIAAPRLGVVIIVDQFSADELARYSGLFTGGFERLVTQGVVCIDAYHDHASTLTAVGHATIATGCYPSHHGIVGNAWYDRSRKARVYSTEDTSVAIVGSSKSKGMSPHNLLVSTLGDWLKEQRPGAKVYALSLKDRSAVLLGGKHPDGVYWIDEESAQVVTTSYYREDLPAWISDFNQSLSQRVAADTEWTKGWPEGTYHLATADSVAQENDGIHTAFPHSYEQEKSANLSQPSWALATPVGDQFVLDLARATVTNEGLGVDSIPDLLLVSLSVTDFVGHSFGPHSQEMIDQLLRLDRSLAGFFGFLDSAFAGDYSVALSADHAIMPFPEELAGAGEPAERIASQDVKGAIDSAAARVAKQLGISGKLITNRLGNWVILNDTLTMPQGLKMPELRRALAEQMRGIHGIADVMTYDDLFFPNASPSGMLAVFRHSYTPERSPDVVWLVRENTLVAEDASGTTHGSPYEYDTHVPILFWGQGVASRRTLAEAVRTIDIAPTMAALLGLMPVSGVDGVVLDSVLVPTR